MYGLTFLEWFYFVIHVFASLFFHIHCPDVFISFWQQLLSWKHVMNQMNPTHEWSWKTGETLVCRVKVKAMWSATLAVPWSQHWGVCVPFAFVRFVMSDRPTLLFHNQRVMFTTNFMPFYLVSWKWLFHVIFPEFPNFINHWKEKLIEPHPTTGTVWLICVLWRPLPMVYDLVNIRYCTSNICVLALAFSMWTWIHY